MAVKSTGSLEEAVNIFGERYYFNVVSSHIPQKPIRTPEIFQIYL